jgi:hypothetical protein
MKICPVGAEVFHDGDRQTDRQTDGVTNLIVTFRISARAPKKVLRSNN